MDKGKNSAKDIIKSRSFIWVAGIQLSIGNLQRVHTGMSSLRAKDTRKHLSNIVHNWLRVTSRELIPEHTWPSPHNGLSLLCGQRKPSDKEEDVPMDFG